MSDPSFTLARKKKKQLQQEHDEHEPALSEKELNLEKLKDLTELDISEQKEEFQLRFVFSLGEDGFRKVETLAGDFAGVCETAKKDATSIPYVSIQFQSFLKETGVYSGDTEKMEVYKTILDLLLDDTDISFIQFLLLYYRKMILDEYEKRWENVSDEALKEKKAGEKKKKDDEDDSDEEDEDSDEEEDVTTGDKLIEELFQPPLGVDTDLDDAIVKFSEMLSKREQMIESLIEKIRSGGRVKATQARTELVQFKAKKEEEINKSKIYFSAAIMHVKKKQDDRFKELRASLELDQEAKLRPRAKSFEELP